MSQTTAESLEKIGREAAELDGAEKHARLLRVKTGIDALGDDAYFFDFQVDRQSDSKTVIEQHLRIARLLRDTLVLGGDENYPYVLFENAP